METYEHKYNELVEAARAVVEGNPGLCDMNKRLGRVRDLLPEKESEDERIRKKIITYLSNELHNVKQLTPRTNEFEAWIAYLEKQKVSPMSSTEVLVRAGLKPYKDGNQWCVLAGDNIQEGICGFGDTIDEALYQFLIDILEKQKEQKPSTEETELNSIAFLEQLGYTCVPPGAEQNPSTPEDIAAAYQMGLADGRKEHKPAECINIEKLVKHIKAEFEAFRNLLKKKGIDYQPTNVYWTDLARLFISSSKKLQKPAEWSEEDEETLNAAIHMVEAGNIVFAFEHNKCQVSDWLVSLPQRFNLQPKQEWSEEDEKMLVGIIERGSAQIPPHEPALREDQMEWLMNRLKSLRPQPHWKPTYKQMAAIEECLRFYTESTDTHQHLKSLLNNLKDL